MELWGLDCLAKDKRKLQKVIFLLWIHQRGIILVQPNQALPTPTPVYSLLTGFTFVMKTNRKLGFAMNHFQGAILIFGPSWCYHRP